MEADPKPSEGSPFYLGLGLFFIVTGTFNAVKNSGDDWAFGVVILLFGFASLFEWGAAKSGAPRLNTVAKVLGGVAAIVALYDIVTDFL